MATRQRGRPLKFGRRAQLVALTLPRDVLAGLRRIHPDPAWAIVSLYERQRRPGRRAVSPGRPSIELAQVSARQALIVVDPRSVRSVPGVSVVPVAAGRAFLAFEDGRGLADLEVAVLERLRDRSVATSVRRKLSPLHGQMRSWRRSKRLRFSKRSIILVERVNRARAGRRPSRRR